MLLPYDSGGNGYRGRQWHWRRGSRRRAGYARYEKVAADAGVGNGAGFGRGVNNL